MTVVTVSNLTKSVEYRQGGTPGPVSLVFDNNGWISATSYPARTALYHGGSSYRAIVTHTAAADNEPGAGASWTLYWRLLAAGFQIGTPGNAQEFNENLQDISDLTPNDDDFMQRKAGGWTNRTPSEAKADLGLNFVNNTSDADKPVSTAQQTALDAKAPINNPTFTGTVAGVSKSMVGLGNVDNTSDANKPVSTAQDAAIDAAEAAATAASNSYSDTNKMAKSANGSDATDKPAFRNNLTVAKYIDLITDLDALDPTKDAAAFLLKTNRFGRFRWNSADLSATLVVRSVIFPNVDAGANTLSMKSALSTAINATTNVITKAAHGLVAGEEGYPSASVNGLMQNGRYYVFFDGDTAAAPGGDTDNFKVRTSLTAAAFDLTGTTNFTFKTVHRLLTGDAIFQSSTVNGLTLNTAKRVVRVDANSIQLSDTAAGAYAGTGIVDITGTDPMTLKQMLDPLGGVYRIRTGDLLDGSQGAYVRDYDKIYGRFFGVVDDYVHGVGGTDNTDAINSAIQFGVNTNNRHVEFPKGKFGAKYPWGSSTQTNISVGGFVDPGNGVRVKGAGPGLTNFYEDETFAAARFCLFDGNMNGVAQVVGSNPMGQGTNYLEDLSLIGRGQAVGTTVGLGTRGVWGMVIRNVKIERFGSHGWEIFSSAAAGPPAHDDVDSNALIEYDNLHISNCGGDGWRSQIARTANVQGKGLTLKDNTGNGLKGAFINSDFGLKNISGNGNVGDTTTGGIRLNTSTSGAICRDNTFRGGTLENNHNFEVNLVEVLTSRFIGGGYNVYHQATDVVNKAAIRITAGCQSLVFINPKFAEYSDPLGYGDIWMFDIATTCPCITVINPWFEHTTSHFQIQSGNAIRIIGPNMVPSITTTGSAPVDCWVDEKPLGSYSSKWPHGYVSLTADNVLLDSSAAQNVFASGSDEFAVLAGRTYVFVGRYIIDRAAGTTSHTTSTLFGGTATLTAISYSVTVSNGNGNVLEAKSGIEVDVATAIAVTAANTSATERVKIKVMGRVRVNAAGTFIPQFKFSAAPGGVPTVKAGSFFEIRDVGVTASAFSGAWS